MCWTLDSDDTVWETCEAQCNAWLRAASQADLFPPDWVAPSMGGAAAGTHSHAADSNHEAEGLSSKQVNDGTS